MCYLLAEAWQWDRSYFCPTGMQTARQITKKLSITWLGVRQLLRWWRRPGHLSLEVNNILVTERYGGKFQGPRNLLFQERQPVGNHLSGEGDGGETRKLCDRLQLVGLGLVQHARPRTIALRRWSWNDLRWGVTRVKWKLNDPEISKNAGDIS